VIENLDARDGSRVIDVGCGQGPLVKLLADLGCRVTGVDPSAVALEAARKRWPDLDLVQIEDSRLPFDDSSFDVATCTHVLEHVLDTQTLLSEIRRVLAPRGLLLLTVPYHGRLKNLAIALGSFERHYDPLEPVVRFYTRRSLRDLLDAFGFAEVDVEARGGRPFLRETLVAKARRT
jgi:ubiquinone/menaquinone biosynthesis C-methylase UbiE